MCVLWFQQFETIYSCNLSHGLKLGLETFFICHLLWHVQERKHSMRIIFSNQIQIFLCCKKCVVLICIHFHQKSDSTNDHKIAKQITSELWLEHMRLIEHENIVEQILGINFALDPALCTLGTLPDNMTDKNLISLLRTLPSIAKRMVKKKKSWLKLQFPNVSQETG